MELFLAFTKALYYPWIDIEDETWLKNAMLYWEKIQTIVPSSIENPYTTRTAQEFCEEGILEPFYVESSMKDIDELKDDVLRYLESPEGVELLNSKEFSKKNMIHVDMSLQEIRKRLKVHPEKLSYALIDKLVKTDGWMKVDRPFLDFYMTLLATRLSERSGTGLLTDEVANYNLSTAARLDVRLSIRESQRNVSDINGSTDMPPTLAQGTLANLVLEKIQIAPDTPVNKILEFRADYAIELGRFRTKIDELTNEISKYQQLDTLCQHVEDIYLNEIIPEISALKEGLKDIKIEYMVKDFLKVFFYSTSPLVLTGIPHALFAGIGVSLTASAILYNRKKASELRQNPYSYLLAAERRFKK